MTLRSRVIPVAALRKDEEAHWEEFRQANPALASPFFSVHYAQTVGLVKRHAYICILEGERGIAGFFPFQFKDRLQRMLGAAERIGEEMTDYFGIIAEPGFETTGLELLRLAGLNWLYFTHLEAGQQAYGLSGEKPEVGLALRLQGDDWAQIRARNSKFGAETDRLERKLGQVYGALRFCFSEENWEAPLNHLMDEKSRQYVRTGGTDILEVRWRKQLLKELAASRNPECSGVLSTLYAGETWIASHFGIRSRDVLQYWFPVYNSELKKFAPGRLLLKQVVQACPAAGIRVLDRGAGDTPAKRPFSNEERLFYRGVWYRPSATALAQRVAWSIRWRWARLRSVPARETL